MHRTSLLVRAVVAISLAAPLVFTTPAGDAAAATSLRPETLGMRASGGFANAARVDQIEQELGRPLSWYVAFADRRDPASMRSSVRGQVKPGSVLGERSGEINVVMTMPLAFGTGDARNAAGRASIKKRLQETAAGKWDEDFRLAARSLIDGGHGNAVLRLGHEFTGAWYPWSAQGNSAAYIAAFRHIHDVMASESPQFRFEWNGARNTFAEHGPAAYPGDKYVDIISLDVYYEPWKGDPAPLTGDIWSRRYIRPMATHLDFAKQHGKQVAYTEWANGLIDQPEFITRMHDWMVGLPASGGGSLAYHSYFNATNEKYNLNGYPKSKATFLRLFGQSAGTPAPAPDPAPTPTPTPTPAPNPPSAGVSAPVLAVAERLDATAGQLHQIPATVDAETVRWWKVSGPGVTWVDKNVGSPTVKFSRPGTYELRVRATNEGAPAVVRTVVATVTSEGSTTPPTTTPPTTTPPTTTPPTTDSSGRKVSVRDASAAEGSTLVFKFVASSTASAPITISYAITDISTEASDYRAVKTGEVTIAKGSKAAFLGVRTVADGVNESAEQLRVRITSIEGAAINRSSGLGTITDR